MAEKIESLGENLLRENCGKIAGKLRENCVKSRENRVKIAGKLSESHDTLREIA